MDCFLRSRDLISYSPMVFGGHESYQTELIDKYREKGNSQFLIDVGANVGLTSCQNGEKFDHVICFEPNPLVCNILRTNLAMRLKPGSFEINEFALGNKNGVAELWIPRHNWGGAFIRSKDSAYKDELLASKDGFSSIDKNNYLFASVKVKSAEKQFRKLFNDLEKRGLRDGVIKIDVEGYEKLILMGIGAVLPSNSSLVIFFENWDKNFDIDQLSEWFSGRRINIGIVETVHAESDLMKPVQLIKRLAGAFSRSRYEKLEDANSMIGDIVVEVL